MESGPWRGTAFGAVGRRTGPRSGVRVQIGRVAAAEVASCVDQPDMTECLRSVPQLTPGNRVVLLAQHAKVVAEVQESLEQPAGLLSLPDPVQGVSQPKGAGEEGAFLSGEAVHAAVGVGLVAQQEAVVLQFPADRGHGADDPIVGEGQEPDPVG